MFIHLMLIETIKTQNECETKTGWLNGNVIIFRKVYVYDLIAKICQTVLSERPFYLFKLDVLLCCIRIYWNAVQELWAKGLFHCNFRFIMHITLGETFITANLIASKKCKQIFANIIVIDFFLIQYELLCIIMTVHVSHANV